jgi:tRNA A-37 threonylcarbamoyl transferase component Bud32
MIAAAHLPHDPALPRLADALDQERMQAELAALVEARAVPGVGSKRVRVERCRIERVRYKPGRSCLVSYALELRVDDADETCGQILCARMYPPNESASRYAKAARAPLASVAFGAPLAQLPSLDMVVWAFPNERKLASLARLTDDAWLRVRTLPGLVTRLRGPHWHLERSSHDLVHYVPEHTCTVRAVLDACRSDGLRRRSVVYGKAYWDDGGRHVGEAMRQLSQSRAVQSGSLGIARPLVYDEQDRVLWQEGLEGETLEQRHPDDRIPEATLRRVAGAVASLHGSPVTQLPRLRPRDVLDELRGRADVIAWSRPQLRPALDRLLRALSKSLPHAGVAATLHGDLHPKNVFLIGDRVWLIDLDAIRRGPAEHDLASWIACMLYRACLRRAPLDAALAAAREFVDCYEAGRGAFVDARALEWYAAAALVNERAHRVLSRLKSGRLEILDDLVQLALRSSGRGLLDATPAARLA